MNRILILIFSSFLMSCNTNKSTILIFENSSDESKIDAGIVITRAEISSWTDVSDAFYPVLLKSDSSYLPTQVDDLDGDDSWDELFVVTDFSGNERKEIILKFVERTSYPQFEIRTNIRFASKPDHYEEVTFAAREKHATNTTTGQVWQMEGPAWENDLVGFRNYFDQRNGTDIFGKVTRKMVMDSVGYKGFPSYHKFNPDWGMDVLKVGESLGAGSIAYLFNDSLYRVGDNGIGTASVIAEGPLRSILKFEFTDWNMSGTIINVKHEISIQAGTYYYNNKVSFNGTDDDLDLVCGIVNKYNCELTEVSDIPNHKAFYTHALQSLDTTLLGMGILIPDDHFAGTSKTPDTGPGITETYCIHQNATSEMSLSYRFYSVWEVQDEKWSDPNAFETLLRKDAENINNPIVIHIQ